MPAAVSIATVDDAEDLTAALAHLVPQLSSSNPPPTRAAVDDILRSPAVDQFVARDESGRIVAVATLVVFDIPTGRRAWIEDVIVDAPSTGQGLGRLLTEAMLDRARQLGCATVDLTSRPTREAANRLYQRVGFVPRETNIYRYQLR